jgi:CheY-like chemotaxis protein
VRREATSKHDLSCCLTSRFTLVIPLAPLFLRRSFQIDSSSSQYKGRSTGLGLAITRLIAAAHCAELRVASAVGEGSVFTLRFPALVHSVGPMHISHASSTTATAFCSSPRDDTVTLGTIAAAGLTDGDPSVELLPIDTERSGKLIPAGPSSDAGQAHLGVEAMRRAQYKAFDNGVRVPSAIEMRRSMADGNAAPSSLPHSVPTGHTGSMEVHGSDAAAQCDDSGAASPPALVASPDEGAGVGALPPRPVARPQLTLSHAESRRPSLRILIVDDSAVNVRMLSRTLERSRLAEAFRLYITPAANGLEGLETIRQGASPPAAAVATGVAAGSTLGGPGGPSAGFSPSPSASVGFDIVLSDAEMPVMDGYEMLVALRAGAAGAAAASLPVVGITGNALPADVNRFRDAGAAAVLLKPVNTSVLIDSVLAALPPARRSLAGAVVAGGT